MNTRPHITVVILTYNEELHIERALASVAGLSERVIVVDSGSTDRTVELAEASGAQVVAHPFTTQALQFNWALEQLSEDTDWILRLDADEVVTPELRSEIIQKIPVLNPDICGVLVGRRIAFQRRPIRWGGLFPIRVLRLFRYHLGRCEERWMDEHIVVEGAVCTFRGEILDDNLQPLSWWTRKHEAYASREVVDLLNRELGCLADGQTRKKGTSGAQTRRKRWMKEEVYRRLPPGLRALTYFLYRYVLRLGFLDGKEGATFHVLQGFWYRYLVDMKLLEVRRYMAQQGVDAPTAIQHVLDINLSARK